MSDPLSTGLTIGKLLLDTAKLIDGKLSDHDASVYKKFLRELTDYRFLTGRFEAEYAGAVIASAERLRKLIINTTTSLADNSKLEKAFFALGAAIRDFLGSVEGIESQIRHELELIEKNAQIGILPDESRKNFLEHWKRNGYPLMILRGNPRLNVMNIEWPGHQMLFLVALGQLRGTFGMLLETLCEASHIELPSPLAGLTPGINELSRNES